MRASEWTIFRGSPNIAEAFLIYSAQSPINGTSLVYDFMSATIVLFILLVVQPFSYIPFLLSLRCHCLQHLWVGNPISQYSGMNIKLSFQLKPLACSESSHVMTVQPFPWFIAKNLSSRSSNEPVHPYTGEMVRIY
ncbi:uncharacterized protein LY89DRAFT_221972 [Mollisia scopiformis]|uniref:Uncharacterized protein n=1 Tax=Mollisia scopiformis TaxID=149040 RepID=A0A194WVW1_MOLSC|nr:uncharacterized protein LY89DRAFT_221972 [Mollisia scopiformis]KUJ12101.1 hypothetical protein LY89DRAFT_221972 [Mollisia scopiformis]